MTVNMRKAASCPFHNFDSHIKNHSPPTLMKATNHNSIPSVSAAIEKRLAELKSSADVRRAPQ